MHTMAVYNSWDYCVAGILLVGEVLLVCNQVILESQRQRRLGEKEGDVCEQ